MSFAMLAPEITSAQMYSGAGSGPMFGAATAWAGLGDELGSAAASFGSVTADLASGPWQGPASAAMAAVAARYQGFLSRAAVRAVTAAIQANTVAEGFDTAKAMVAHPGTVRANRLQFVSAIRSNFLGLNGPLIAAIEGAYDELWAKNVSALVGYHSAASAAAARILPWQDVLGDVSGRIGRVAAADGAMVKATFSANRADVAGASRLTRAAAQAAAADLQAGQLVPAVREIGSAAAYDAQTVSRVVTRDVALPGQLIGKDIDIFAAPAVAPTPAPAPEPITAAAADLGAVPSQIAKADADAVARVLADNQVQLLKAEAVTDSGLRAAEAAVLAGDPVAAARDVASTVALGAQIVGQVAVDDINLPANLLATDFGLLAGVGGAGGAWAAALPTDPGSLAHYVAVKAANIAAVPAEIAQLDGPVIGQAVDSNQTAFIKAATVTQNDLQAAVIDLESGYPVKAAGDVVAALAYDYRAVTDQARLDAGFGYEVLSVPATAFEAAISG